MILHSRVVFIENKFGCDKKCSRLINNAIEDYEAEGWQMRGQIQMWGTEEPPRGVLLTFEKTDPEDVPMKRNFVQPFLQCEGMILHSRVVFIETMFRCFEGCSILINDKIKAYEAKGWQMRGQPQMCGTEVREGVLLTFEKTEPEEVPTKAKANSRSKK